MVVAIPRYVGNDTSEAPPGHRFRLYFPGWRDDWTLHKEKKREALDAVRAVPSDSIALVEKLRDRQASLAERCPKVFTIDARTTAPLVTGVGMEHPLKNGFAFIDPYGMPYLPGGGVKGVVRRAAEDLALFEEDAKGWSVGAVWWLFGFDGTSAYLTATKGDESQEERSELERWQDAYRARTAHADEIAQALIELHAGSLRDRFSEVLRDGPRALQGSAARERIHQGGALEFWDVYVQPPAGALRVDIMNPHFSHYYQDGRSPSDDGHPNPIFFLAVPPGSLLTFHVRLRETPALPSLLRDGWMPLVRHAVVRALDWNGFGAKTAVGYGRMSLDPEAAQRRAEERRKQESLRIQRMEAERKAREEEDRRIRMEALGETERLIENLKVCAEVRVHEIYGQYLDSLHGEERLQLAMALRGAYERFEKWEKPSAPKQQAKVAKLKSILGDR